MPKLVSYCRLIGNGSINAVPMQDTKTYGGKEVLFRAFLT